MAYCQNTRVYRNQLRQIRSFRRINHVPVPTTSCSLSLVNFYPVLVLPPFPLPEFDVCRFSSLVFWIQSNNICVTSPPTDCREGKEKEEFNGRKKYTKHARNVYTLYLSRTVSFIFFYPSYLLLWLYVREREREKLSRFLSTVSGVGREWMTTFSLSVSVSAPPTANLLPARTERRSSRWVEKWKKSEND